MPKSYSKLSATFLGLLLFCLCAGSLAAQPSCGAPPDDATYTGPNGLFANPLTASFKPSNQASFDGDEYAFAVNESIVQVGMAVCVSQSTDGQYVFNGIVINRTFDCFQPAFGSTFEDVSLIGGGPACSSTVATNTLRLTDQTGAGNYEGYFFVIFDPDNGGEFFVVSGPGGAPFDGSSSDDFGGSTANPPVAPGTAPDDSREVPDESFSSLDEAQAALPIELSALTGRYNGKQVIVEWTTATETANDFFEVQRADASGAFEVIGRVSGAGDSRTALDYTFADDSPYRGENLYRLRQVDFGGDFSYSQVISVTAPGGPTADFLLYPNPVAATLNVRLGGEWQDRVTFQLSDAAGRNLRQWTVAAATAVTEVAVADLPRGVYQLRATDGVQQSVRRVVKR